MTAPPTNTALQDALALHRQGKHELAMQRYVSVLQTDPKNLDALYYVAVLAIQQGQLEEGLKVIARGLDIGPAQARFHNLRGQTQLRLNKDQDALASFGAAIECDPGFVDAYGNRGTLLAEMGRPAQALADFAGADFVDLDTKAARQCDLTPQYFHALGGTRHIDAAALLPAEHDVRDAVHIAGARTPARHRDGEGAVGDVPHQRRTADDGVARDLANNAYTHA